MKGVLFVVLVAFFSVVCNGQQTANDSLSQPLAIDTLPPLKPDYTFATLAKGVEWCVTDAPERSIVNDSKLSILRVDPSYFDFELLMHSQYAHKLTVNQWADSFDLNIVFNAGMYELSDGKTSRGFLKGYDHYNNRNIHPNYNLMFALNPTDTLEKACKIIDLDCDKWDNIKDDYHCFAQGLRMIDCSKGLIGWNKRKQSCSMLVAATDPLGRIYLIFSRSPYTHNDIIKFMSQMPYELYNAIYLEGGPETSLYINVNGEEITRLGSYVSGSYPKDTNTEFWKLPNVIGLRYK